MKYFFVFSLFFMLNKNSLGQVKTGDKFGGIVKLTIVTAKSHINGKWNTSDFTGNVAVDTSLNKFAMAYKANPKAIAALENAAADIKSNPEKFLNADGSVNKDAFMALINQKFAGTDVTVPSSFLIADSNTNGSLRKM